MIDELWLTAALEDAVQAIEIPDDGPASVLAARRRLFPDPFRDDPFAGDAFLAASGPGETLAGDPSGRQAASPPTGIPFPSTTTAVRRRRALVFAGAVAAGLVAVFAIVTWPGRSSSKFPSKFSAVGSSVEPPALSNGAGSQTAAPGLSAGSGSSAGVGTDLTPRNPGGPAVTAAPPAPVPAVATRVVKTGSVTLQVQHGAVSATINQLTTDAAGLGGYVADAKSDENGTTPTGDLTLRVPNDQFEKLLDEARSLGRPVSVTTAGRDVTAEYVDLDARIKSLQATRDQFLQILTRAGNIGDILAVEQQISGLQTQIEQLQGQQRVLDDQTTFGSLAVHVAESSGAAVPAAVPKPPSGLSKSWAHARHAFVHGIESVVAASGGVGVFLLSVAILVVLVRIGWSLVRRRLV